MAEKDKSKYYFAIVVFCLIAYSLLFILNSSFVLDGKRYFCLHDDSMISMCYAKNFAEGHGLIWTKLNDRVEGFSNPLWVVVMILFHLFFEDLSKIPLLVQFLGLIFLVVNMFYIEKLIKTCFLFDERVTFLCLMTPRQKVSQ